VQSSVINEERMSIIADLSKDYEDAIKEALSERIQLRSSAVSSNAFDITGRINTIYQEKCNQYGSLTDISLRSGTDETVFDVDKLQLYLDILQENWDVAIQNAEEDDSKEDFIAKLQTVTTRGLFSWVKKNLKKIECTAKSVGAVATCAAAAVPPVTVAAWAGCVAATASAAACWASI
jgi:hypothetical protein